MGPTPAELETDTTSFTISGASAATRRSGRLELLKSGCLSP